MSNQCPATCHSYTLEPEAGFSLQCLKAGEKIILNGVNNVRAGAPVVEISHEEAKKAFEGK